MNQDAVAENRLTLMKLLGLNEASSEKIVGSAVLISVMGDHPRLAEFLTAILQRTFETVHTAPKAGVSYSCEIISNPAYKIGNGPYVFLGQKSKETLSISMRPPLVALQEKTHPFLYFIIACYAGGMVLRKTTNSIPIKADDEIAIEMGQVIKNKDIFDKEVNVGRVYLAGAGAVGNAFLYALSTFQVEGEIKVADPDFVSGSNLNRCLLFDEDDIEKNKVDVLTQKAQPYFKKLKLTPLPHELNKIPDNIGGAWLEKLVVGVDSRRARRNLQGEIPREVFDASTTGISEVVVHHHKRPLEGACLGCIYAKEKQEEAHEIHIAESLGVTLNHVKRQFIDNEAAGLIATKYQLHENDIVGIPYDTLFKQLCGEGKLMTPKNTQVLAPLAFVSALAGAFLALMFVEKHLGITGYNYWRISPWANLNYRLQQNLRINPECEFCNSELFKSAAKSMWG